MTRSDKEARSRLQRVGEEGGDAAALQAVLELRRLDPHHVPGHLAGDHPDAEFACETDHVLERSDVLLLHHGPQHLRAHAEVVHLRDGKRLAGPGRHDGHRLLEEALPFEPSRFLEDREAQKVKNMLTCWPIAAAPAAITKAARTRARSPEKTTRPTRSSGRRAHAPEPGAPQARP